MAREPIVFEVPNDTKGWEKNNWRKTADALNAGVELDNKVNAPVNNSFLSTGKIKISDTDKVSDYLNLKLAAGTGITFTKSKTGGIGSEILTVDSHVPVTVAAPISLLGQAISIPAATNAVAGHATAAHIQAIEANTAKVTNATHTGEVTGSGALTITAKAVTYAKIQDLAADKILGAVTAGAPVEIACTAAGRALLDDVSAAAQATTLGLGTADGPSFAHLHLADVAAITTAAESWVGPSSTTGVCFKGGKVGFGTNNPLATLHINGTGLYFSNDADGTGIGIIYIGSYSSWQGGGTDASAVLASYGTKDLIFGTSATERMRILATNGNVWMAADCSALSFTDRTPHPKDLQEAYVSVNSVVGKNGQVDHTKLDKFIQSKDKDGNVEGRNLSALVSAQNEVLKDLLARINKLEGK